MNGNYAFSFFLGVFVGMWLIIGLTLCFPEGTPPYRNGYRTGQIDAISSVINYELREQSDGTIEWEHK